MQQYQSVPLIGYKRLAITDFKPQDGNGRETILFLHGLGSSQNFYTPIIPKLVKDGYRCIAFDHTGAGRSPYTQVEQSIETLGNDALGVLDHFGVEKAVVVGHSMSGIIASHLGSAFPQRIAALVLVGPVHPTPTVAGVMSKRASTLESAKSMAPMVSTIPDGAVAPSASSLVRSFVRELLSSQPVDGYISNCRVIARAQPPAYDKVACPVLMLAGVEDKTSPIASCKNIFEQLGTRAEEKVWSEVADCGHWLVLEKSEEIGSRLEKFLRDIQ